MAISFPATFSAFFSKLPIQTAELDLLDAFEMEETGAGEIITSDRGERLWQMALTIAPKPYDDAEDIQALIRMFRKQGATFYAHAIPRKNPRFDPTGSILTGSGRTPALHTVNGNMRDIRISNLPPQYRLATGDFLSFGYGTNPTRFAFHQIVGSTVTADANGLSPVFEVNPAIRLGYVIGGPVDVTRPYFKAHIVPNTATPGKIGQQWTTGISLTIRQTLGR